MNSARRRALFVGALTGFFGFAAALFIGCKASEAPSTGFTTAQLMDHDPQIPFHKVWRKPGVDFYQYHKIFIADVNTQFMLAHTVWQKGERQGEIENDVRDLAVFTKAELEKVFREDPNHRFEVLASPSRDADAMILQMAITEVVPSKVVLNALGYAPFGIGIAVTAARTVAQDQSSAAFEARILDGPSSQVIGMAADRESEQFAPVSVRGLTWYSHAKTMISLWAQQFVQIANRKPGETVQDTDTFTLKPW